MSGGSYDYAYCKIDDFTGSLQRTTPLRKAFASHLAKVSKAMHDIEWVDSGDCAEGDEAAAIRAVLGKDGDAMELEEVVKDARIVLSQLTEILNRVWIDEVK